MSTVAQTTPAPETPVSSTPKADLRPLQRLANFGKAPRVMAVDVLRALALIGMISAHFWGAPDEFDILKPSTYWGLVHGFPALTFAFVAGISIAFMTGRTQLPSADEMPKLRLRLLGRGAAIFLIGLILEALGSPILVILTLYGALYIVIMPFVTMSRAKLLAWAAGFGIVGPALLAVVWELSYPYGSGFGLLFQSSYQSPAWLAMMLVGLAVGRCDLHATRVKAAILGAGAAVLLVATLLIVPFSPAVEQFDDYSESSSTEVPGEQVNLDGYACMQDYDTWFCYPADEQPDQAPQVPEPGEADAKDRESWIESGWSEWVDSLDGHMIGQAALDAIIDHQAHSGATFEILQALGVALLLLGVLLFIVPPLRLVFIPFAALGSMPLTIYSAHILVAFGIAGPGGSFESWQALLATVLGGMAFALVWSMFYTRGPLEAFTRNMSLRASGEQAARKKD